MLLNQPIPLTPLHRLICDTAIADETELVRRLIKDAGVTQLQRQHIAQMAVRYIKAVRQLPTSGLDALLQEYDLSNQEGVALMCLAEALLRIPDDTTIDALIRDKLSHANWEQHLGKSDSVFVNASTWGLMLTGKLIELDPHQVSDVGSFLSRLVSRSGEPAIRMAIKAAMRIIGQQFVLAQDIETACEGMHDAANALYSFDMLGEAALTQEDAATYLAAYRQAIEQIGRIQTNSSSATTSQGISIKLSALHPRFELFQRDRVLRELVPNVLGLCQLAREYGLQLTIDAEEAHRLDLTLDVFSAVFTDPSLDDWAGMGLAVQAYQKRAGPVIDYLAALSREHNRRMCIRLVKGAYWDSEIKLAQQQGLSGYPVFTRKIHSDVSYIACVKKLFAEREAFYPQFATHNAHSIATILELAGTERDFEFQRLHGMGKSLYDAIQNEEKQVRCRIYAPVGQHADLLPYLVRRLLENGANTSFVNRITDERIPVEQLIYDPVELAEQDGGRPHQHIRLPTDLYLPTRQNAEGVQLDNPTELNYLKEQLDAYQNYQWQFNTNSSNKNKPVTVTNPADRNDNVGHYYPVQASDVAQAFDNAQQAFSDWSMTPVKQRSDLLNRLGDLLEENRTELLAMLIREAGRCIRDVIAEFREAVDFCRYYAWQARQQLAHVIELPGPTGERNQLGLHGRGVVVCISPWNFPLSIFLGQVSAALVAGNTVIAKPASATPLIAARVSELIQSAGFPKYAMQLLTGSGDALSKQLLTNPQLAGVLFTGSTQTANTIQSTLARRDGPLVPFVAETGGINCMIVDSSALAEQVVSDVIQSAFNSAGQRCSALRLLYIQQDVADQILHRLKGAMDELHIGSPKSLQSDIGPVISQSAQQQLQDYIKQMDQTASLVHRLPLDSQHENGFFVSPCVYEIDAGSQLQQEVFGPILHVVRYSAHALDNVIDDINQSGFGLTLGIHSRIQNTIDKICQRARVGNIYVNRNMIVAVVGVQPFGGEGLSGTGPKAGGPHYLTRLVTERVVSQNITAIGGNAILLSSDD